MSKKAIREWVEVILGHEGGFTQNPEDDGNWTGGNKGSGELKGTNWGISAAAYPELDIRNLTKEQAVDIYEQDYAEPLGLERFNPVVAIQLLDYAVNSGVSAASKGLQRALGGLALDGVIGPKTIARYKEYRPRTVAYLLSAERLLYMTKLSGWPYFGRGWARRIAANIRIVAGG